MPVQVSNAHTPESGHRCAREQPVQHADEHRPIDPKGLERRVVDLEVVGLGLAVVALRLGLLLGSSVAFFLLALVATWSLTGTLAFRHGGILAGVVSPGTWRMRNISGRGGSPPHRQ